MKNPDPTKTMNTERSRFRPAKYGSRVVTDGDVSSRSGFSRSRTPVVEKGGTDVLKIDVTELDRLIKNLRMNANTPIRELPDELGEQFRQLISYVSLLYDSSSYPILYNVVHKYFANLETVIPGTIGAYCAGCHVETSLSNTKPGCAPICAGSMPPKNDDWTFCQNTVILATYEGNRFTFTLLKSGETKNDKSLASIFVNYSSHNAFPGFSDAEKQQLKSLGIERVNLNGYMENGREYIELVDGPIVVDKTKSRVSVVETPTLQGNGFGDTGLIILIIILILVGLFFAWRFWQDRRSDRPSSRDGMNT